MAAAKEAPRSEEPHGPRPEDIVDIDGLVSALTQLRVRAGHPSYRTLAKTVGPLLRPPRDLPFRTLAHVFESGRRRLDLDLVLAIVRALGVRESDVPRWRAAFARAHAEPKAHKTIGVTKAAGPARTLRQLPAPIGMFVGREAELNQLIAAAVEGRAGTPVPAMVITAIDGMAGIGKSALAVRAAHLLAERFPDGQLFLDLHGYSRGRSPRDPSDALAALLASLDVPPARIPAELDARAAVYRDRLAGTRTLILLDNAAAEEQIRPLLPGDAGCMVLATSRRRLKGLDEARTVTLDVLSATDAVTLMRALAGPGPEPDARPLPAETEDPAWQQVAELCGHLPLALRIAASLLRHRTAWTLDHLASRLRAAPLEIGSFSDGERDVWAVFDLSYQSLDVDQQRLLRRLGLIPGTDIDPYAAAALSDTDPDRAELLLEDLVDHHLLDEPAVGRYRMHDLVRAYAHAQATARDAEPERDRALDRLLRYYAHTAQSASQTTTRFPRPEPTGPAPAHAPDVGDPDAATAWLRAEQPNLDAAFLHARTHRLDEHTVALASGLAEILYTDSPWARMLDVHQTAAEAAERLGRPAAHAIALTDLGRARRYAGDPHGAEDALTRAVKVYRSIDDLNGEAMALADLGRLRHAGGQDAEIEAVYVRVLEIQRSLGDRAGEASALTDLGRFWYLAGNFADGDDALVQALQIYRDLGHRRGQAIVLTSLGQQRPQAGNMSGVGEALAEALEIYRELGHRRGEAIALTSLGMWLVDIADFPTAGGVLTQALEIYRELGYRSGEANALTTLGRVRHRTGDGVGALEAFTEALEIFRETGERGNEAWALNHYAAATAASGDRTRALAIYQQALEMTRELRKFDDEAIALEGIGDHYLAVGDAAEGNAHLLMALEIYQRLGMDADAQRVAARALLDAGSEGGEGKAEGKGDRRLLHSPVER